MEHQTARVTVTQLPPSTTAPSVHSSRIIVDLLVHAISFLSLFQWSQVGQVNHAWRNATLRPSAFPLDSHKSYDLLHVGLLHRACIRYLCIGNKSSCTLATLSEFTHLQEFEGTHSSSPSQSKLIESLSRIHPQLTALNFDDYANSTPIASIESLTELRLLKELKLCFIYGSQELEVASRIIPQLQCDLTHFGLRIRAMPLDSEERHAAAGAAAAATLSSSASLLVLTTIISSPSFTNNLRVLSLTSGVVHLASVMSHLSTLTLPQLTTLSLCGAEIGRDITDEQYTQIARFTCGLPTLHRLELMLSVSPSILYSPRFRSKRQLVIDSILAGVTPASPHLKYIFMQFITSYDPDEIMDWDSNDESYEISHSQILSLVTSCRVLERFTFINFGEDNYPVTHLIPKLMHVTPTLTHVEPYINWLTPLEVSELIQSIVLKFTHLKHLVLGMNSSFDSSVRFGPPTSTFLSLRDKMANLQQLTCDIDIETQLPELLRLLPKIDSIKLSVRRMPADRLFEYAQYRTIISSRDRSSRKKLYGMSNFDLTWFDSDPCCRFNSILSPESILPSHLHSHYHHGLELSRQPAVDIGQDGPNISHGWMFARVRRWCWQYSWVVVSNEEGEEKQLSSDSKLLGSAVVDALAFTRSFVCTCTHSNTTDQQQFRTTSVRTRLAKQIKELKMEYY